MAGTEMIVDVMDVVAGTESLGRRMIRASAFGYMLNALTIIGQEIVKYAWTDVLHPKLEIGLSVEQGDAAQERINVRRLKYAKH